MAINYKRLDLLLRYILVVAGQNDQYERELGMIHLIKYAYLADLAHATRHNGKTFTGLPWEFYHLGPWAVECHQRIEPALASINATKRIVESQEYDDFIRWSIDDDELFDRLGDQLELTVMSAVQKYMRMFGTDTYVMLDYVYKTQPMLNAAPGEMLNFKYVTAIKKILKGDKPKAELTAKQKKLRHQKFMSFKEKLNKNLEQQIQDNRSKTCPLPPRYDEVFFEGMANLDAAAGSPPTEGEYLATFSEDIWKSKSRHDPEVS